MTTEDLTALGRKEAARRGIISRWMPYVWYFRENDLPECLWVTAKGLFSIP